MGTMPSQITSLAIVYSTVYSGADQRKDHNSASLAFVRWIHRGPVNSPHKWPVTRKIFPFDDVIMVHHKRKSHLFQIHYWLSSWCRKSSSTICYAWRYQVHDKSWCNRNVECSPKWNHICFIPFHYIRQNVIDDTTPAWSKKFIPLLVFLFLDLKLKMYSPFTFLFFLDL